MMAEEKLCRKYIVRKTDGSDIPKQNKYFVLRYDSNAKHGKANREVLTQWCNSMRDEMPELSQELLNDINRETR